MIFTITRFLGNLLSNINEKDIIIIQDKYYCLENILNVGKKKLVIKGHNKPYKLYDTNKNQNYIDYINGNDFKKRNIILIVRNERFCINSIRKNCRNLILDRIKITPRHFFSDYYKSLKKTNFDFSYWNDDIFVFNKFLPKIARFIIDNIDFYESVKDDRTNLHKFIISCLFEEINEILFKDNFFIYIFEKFIQYDSIIYDIFNCEDLNKLREIIIEILKKELKSEEIFNYFLSIIQNQNLEAFFYFLLYLLILTETTTTPALIADLRDFQSKIGPVLPKLKLDSLSNENIKKFTELAKLFFKYEIESKNLYKITNFITPFRNSSLIQEIEYKFNFFNIFFQILPLNTNTYEQITSKRFLYSSIIAFGMVIYNKIFQFSLSYGIINNLASINEDELAQIRFYLQNLKENIYYKINLNEFHLHFQFLEEILTFYQIYQDLANYLNLHQPKSFSIDKWNDIYQHSIVPLDLIYLRISESKRLFWQTKEYQEMVKVIRNKLKKIIDELSLDFKDFITDNYPKWVSNPSSGPVSVVNVFQRFFKPGLTPESKGDYHLFLIIDCCPLSIWTMIKTKIIEDFDIIGVKSIIGTSILPTSTRWARRALASGKYPDQHIGIWYEADDFFSLISNFPIHKLTSQPNMESFYTSHCELIEQNDKAIEQIGNTINFQYCVFNISDESGHIFDLNTVLKIVELTYSTKIKPLLQELLSKKPNAIIYFATDHGITKILKTFNWRGTNFQNYRNAPYIKAKNTHPRFFITEQKLSPTKSEILKIENNQSNYGLYEKDLNNLDQYYYFSTGYDNFKREKSAKNIYFAHGGASFFEFLIPFAILSKKFKIDKPLGQPILKKTIKKSGCEIKILNPFQKSINFLIIHLIFNDFYFKYYINKVNANDGVLIKRNKIKNEGNSYEYILEYYFEEKYYCTDRVIIN